MIEQGDPVLMFEIDEMEVALAAEEPILYQLSNEERTFPRWSIKLDELEPPIAKGDRLGEVISRLENQEIGRAGLVTTMTVPRHIPLLRNLAWIGWVLVALGLLVHLRRHRRRNRNVFRRRGVLRSNCLSNLLQ
ncbi:MAG: hypothetical protein ACE5MK_07880 [Acidobacteriota bacterium]